MAKQTKLYRLNRQDQKDLSLETYQIYLQRDCLVSQLESLLKVDRTRVDSYVHWKDVLEDDAMIRDDCESVVSDYSLDSDSEEDFDEEEREYNESVLAWNEFWDREYQNRYVNRYVFTLQKQRAETPMSEALE